MLELHDMRGRSTWELLGHTRAACRRCYLAEGAPALASAVQGSRTLQELDLRVNALGPAGAAAVAGALRGSRSLRTLRLAGNGPQQPDARGCVEAVLWLFRKSFRCLRSCASVWLFCGVLADLFG